LYTKSLAEVDESKRNPLIPATNIQLEIEQRAGPKGQAGVAFLRFVAVSGDNGTENSGYRHAG
jgi:hypothetical protein